MYRNQNPRGDSLHSSRGGRTGPSFCLENPSKHTMDELNHVAAEPVAVVEQNGDVLLTEAVGPKQEESAQPTPVSDEEVKQRLLVLLGKSDLNQTTGAARGKGVGCCAAAVGWFAMPSHTCVLPACLPAWGNPLQRRC